VAEERCAVSGVFAPLTGVVGSLQAAEALKLLTGVGTPLTGRLLLIDILTQTFRAISFGKDPSCPVCGGSESRRKCRKAGK
jgi:adenylyltransferase/sulfurtransferase